MAARPASAADERHREHQHDVATMASAERAGDRPAGPQSDQPGASTRPARTRPARWRSASPAAPSSEAIGSSGPSGWVNATAAPGKPAEREPGAAPPRRSRRPRPRPARPAAVGRPGRSARPAGATSRASAPASAGPGHVTDVDVGPAQQREVQRDAEHHAEAGRGLPAGPPDAPRRTARSRRSPPTRPSTGRTPRRPPARRPRPPGSAARRYPAATGPGPATGRGGSPAAPRRASGRGSRGRRCPGCSRGLAVDGRRCHRSRVCGAA